ncbi:hypothetical protein BDN72DRAFT_830764 [Pluteus cervinus]|uniref:Uncharacterized protein n=1 Tax=Pluteus cervinus TaxID=181527 RepID=A0ACD3BDX6_9AGAR|nr:hypothetical protein BDN72DRAFT_830764 [Pluteus cervinus]
MECETPRRIPTLTQLCQRVALAHIDSITNLGSEISFRLVRPILERCNAEQLLLIEEASPHLIEDTLVLWKDLCSQKYPLQVERYLADHKEEPDSWRDQYFVFLEAERERLEQITSRLRMTRAEEQERKKEREVKFTDRLPPPPRKFAAWAPAKSLFQKTRSEAQKKRTMFSAPMLPPMPGKNPYHVLSKPPPLLPPPPPSSQPSRVTVNTIIQRRPAVISTQVSKPTHLAPGILKSTPPPISAAKALDALIRCQPQPSPNRGTEIKTSTKPPDPKEPPPSAVVIEDPRPIKPPPKKFKATASLFLPKHRAYSQRPTQPPR